MAATTTANRHAVPAPALPVSVDADFNVADMALYELTRARSRLRALEAKPQWEPADTASFDCMHYQGDAALHAAAQALELQPGARVVDVGAGFGATGRFLNKHYGAEVTGVELQPEIHDMAETITARNGQSAKVRSINGDFTQLPAAAFADAQPVDHVVSFLCILHIPNRASVFGKAASMLRKGGTIYIEDYFAQSELDETTLRQLRDVVSCPYLPSQARYIADLKAAGFGNVVFVNMTKEWSEFVHGRVVEYKQSSAPEPLLLTFYNTVDELFRGGRLGGARIMATKIE
ncbi:hypothetical protein BB8028_0001g00390 [Beauveria bassiana]|uniref:phosphoethanolamine N-methyltransferase n=1 Tax=Beauveria bassiana TaxID=176275 RepID=A0A2S7XVI9_BEABA|nr:hypothetical protein BB8028_0001g00390 [Beauveria bassiana]